MVRYGWLSAALLGGLLTAGSVLAADPSLPTPPQPVSGAEDCDPEVDEALAQSAERGVLGDVEVIRHPVQGVRNPDSILGFSCLDRLFDYSLFDVHVSPKRAINELLGLVRREVCSVSRDVYRQYVGRTLDARVYTRRLPRIPGVVVRPDRGNVIEDIGPQRRPAASRRAPDGGVPAGDVDLFRSVIGGGR